MEKFCYLDDKIRVRTRTRARTRNEWDECIYDLCLISTGCLLLGVKGRLCSAFVHNVILYGSEAWPFKEDDVIRVEKNDAKTFR